MRVNEREEVPIGHCCFECWENINKLDILLVKEISDCLPSYVLVASAIRGPRIRLTTV